MPTTLTNGIQLPDKGSVDWYNSMQSNYNLIDTHLGDTDTHVTAEDKANWNSKQGSLSQAQLDAIAQVATNTDDIATLQSGKADASHTHPSSDITDIDDYATKDYVDNSISGLVDNAPDALNTLNELSAALNDDANFASTVTTALAAKANSADLATVATSGDYNDLDNLPTIPTKISDLSNDSDFVVSSNLATVATSGDYDDLSNKPSIPTNTSDLNNDSGFVTLNDFDIPSKTSDLTNDSGFITSSDVPTSTSDLTNDSNFVDTSNPAVSSGITSAKVTDYDTHIADTDIHVTTADKNKWNNGVTQAYVFRYSSTALVASSTNSNTLLDNTDNLKVGDKVIDSNGVLFSITAIDTANSTFTVGSALVDLATDGDVVHKSGDETVGGVKTLSNGTLIVNNTMGSNVHGEIKLNGSRLGYIVADNSNDGVFNNNNCGVSILLQDENKPLHIGGYKVDSNGRVFADNTNKKPVLSLTSNLIKTATLVPENDTTNVAFRFLSELNYANGNPSKTLDVRFIQFDDANASSAIYSNDDGKTSLGVASRRWSKIYGTEYYYGSNNVEFSTKFVTTDTNQTISGQKLFDDINIISSSSEIGVSGGNRSYKVLDKNKKILARLEGGTFSSGMAYSYWLVNNGTDGFNGVSLYQPSANLAQLRPYDSTLSVQLGASNRPFSDCYTSKINGVEPSSLSLPSDRSARIDISSYITNLGNGDNNQYIVPANGYIWLHFTSINSALCYSQTSGGLTTYAQTFTRYSGDGQLYAFFPVRKNDYFIVQIYTASTAVVQNAYFIPCQGNV